MFILLFFTITSALLETPIVNFPLDGEGVLDLTVQKSENLMYFSVTRHFQHEQSEEGWFAVGFPKKGMDVGTGLMVGSNMVIATNNGVQQYEPQAQSCMQVDWKIDFILNPQVTVFDHKATMSFSIDVEAQSELDFETFVFAFNTQGSWDPTDVATGYHQDNKGVIKRKTQDDFSTLCRFGGVCDNGYLNGGSTNSLDLCENLCQSTENCDFYARSQETGWCMVYETDSCEKLRRDSSQLRSYLTCPMESTKAPMVIADNQFIFDNDGDKILNIHVEQTDDKYIFTVTRNLVENKSGWFGIGFPASETMPGMLGSNVVIATDKGIKAYHMESTDVVVPSNELNDFLYSDTIFYEDYGLATMVFTIDAFKISEFDQTLLYAFDNSGNWEFGNVGENQGTIELDFDIQPSEFFFIDLYPYFDTERHVWITSAYDNNKIQFFDGQELILHRGQTAERRDIGQGFWVKTSKPASVMGRNLIPKIEYNLPNMLNQGNEFIFYNYDRDIEFSMYVLEDDTNIQIFAQNEKKVWDKKTLEFEVTNAKKGQIERTQIFGNNFKKFVFTIISDKPILMIAYRNERGYTILDPASNQIVGVGLKVYRIANPKGGDVIKKEEVDHLERTFKASKRNNNVVKAGPGTNNFNGFVVKYTGVDKISGIAWNDGDGDSTVMWARPENFGTIGVAAVNLEFLYIMSEHQDSTCRLGNKEFDFQFSSSRVDLWHIKTQEVPRGTILECSKPVAVYMEPKFSDDEALFPMYNWVDPCNACDSNLDSPVCSNGKVFQNKCFARCVGETLFDERTCSSNMCWEEDSKIPKDQTCSPNEQIFEGSLNLEDCQNKGKEQNAGFLLWQSAEDRQSPDEPWCTIYNSCEVHDHPTLSGTNFVYRLCSDKTDDDTTNNNDNNSNNGSNNNGNNNNNNGGGYTGPTVDNEVVETLKALLGENTRQMLLMQQFSEHDLSSRGSSGVTRVRANVVGTEIFYPDGGIANGGTLAIHNHPNHERTLGMGEFGAILNGVRFDTRHNDYKIKKPAADAHTKLNKVEDIEYPDVPPSVLNKESVEEQVTEMKKFFEAFAKQDPNVVPYDDYNKYFKPVMCYLEGAWIIEETNGDIGSLFDSDRHFIEQATWKDLNDAQIFRQMTGKKHISENTPFLPKKIVDVKYDPLTNIEYPVYANFKYRILCQPLENQIPTARFVLNVDEHLMTQTAQNNFKFQEEDMLYRRRAMFRLNSLNENKWNKNANKKGRKQRESTTSRFEYLDDLMMQVPGKDGPNKILSDDSFGIRATKWDDREETLNTARYSRFFSYDAKDAMGRMEQMRGYSDMNMFAAMTEHKEVSGRTICKDGQCWTQRWTYAIPLEIVYLTPLEKWNPCQIEKLTGSEFENLNEENDGSKDKPMEGYTTNNNFIKIPSSFFYGSGGTDLADTGVGYYVKTAPEVNNGNHCHVVSSGTKIVMDPILFDGDSSSTRIRLRYPIAPVHDHSTLAFREVAASKTRIRAEMKAMRTELNEFKSLFQTLVDSVETSTSFQDLNDGARDIDVGDVGSFAHETQVGKYSKSTYPPLVYLKSGPGTGDHIHEIPLSWENYKALMEGKTVNIRSSEWDGHLHDFEFHLDDAETLGFEKCSGCENDPHKAVFLDEDYRELFNPVR